MNKKRYALCIIAAAALAVACLFLPARTAAADMLPPAVVEDGGSDPFRRGDDVIIPAWEVQRVASAEEAVPKATDAVPLPRKAATAGWSLANLVSAVGTVGCAVAVSLGLLGGGGSRLKGALRTLSLLPAALSAGLFLFTQNMTGSMTLLDGRTVWMLLFALLECASVIILTAKRPRTHEETD